MAAPHNPAPTANILMLNRSKIVINVNSFFRAQISPQSSCAAPPDRVMPGPAASLLAAGVQREQRRTVPFPNGDV
jgi:hypothetical protein